MARRHLQKLLTVQTTAVFQQGNLAMAFKVTHVCTLWLTSSLLRIYATDLLVLEFMQDYSSQVKIRHYQNVSHYRCNVMCVLWLSCEINETQDIEPRTLHKLDQYSVSLSFLPSCCFDFCFSSFFSFEFNFWHSVSWSCLGRSLLSQLPD